LLESLLFYLFLNIKKNIKTQKKLKKK